MIPNDPVWVFHGASGRFASGVFRSEALAREWIRLNRLSGTLTAYPVDEGVFDWADRVGAVNMKPEKLEAKRGDSSFIGGFTTASQEHFHFENGEE